MFLLQALLAPPALAEPTPVSIRQIEWAFVNAWAVTGPEGTILIDTHDPGEAGEVLAALAEADIAPDSVRAIILTHGHADHAGNAEALRAATGAPILIGAADVVMTQVGHNTALIPTDLRGRALRPLLVQEYPSFQPNLVVDDTVDLGRWGIPGQVIVVGGHTGGALVVKLDSGELFSGDLIRGGMLSAQKPTLHFFHDDPERSHAALGTLLPGATVLYPGHGGPLDPVDVAAWLEGR